MADEVKRDRRDFLKDAAVVGAAVAAGTVVGMAPADAAAAPMKWDKETDVLIIGAGVAGMCAAIEAADAGAQVLVIDKEPQPGGQGKLSGGAHEATGTAGQARYHIEDTVDSMYEDYMENGEMVAVPELVRTYCENSAAQIRWLESLGVTFNGPVARSPNHRVGRAQSVTSGLGPAYLRGGMALMITLLQQAEKRGVTTLLNHQMTGIVRAGANGPAVGARVLNDKKVLNFRARKGVIVATGGWMSNVQMRMAEDPRLTSDVFASGPPYLTNRGEGHLAVVDAGGALSGMGYIGFLPTKWACRVYAVWEPPTFENQPTQNVGVLIDDFQRVIVVKGDGKRYVNEMLGGTPMGPMAYPKVVTATHDYPKHPWNEAYLNLKERPRNVWAIADAEGAVALRWPIEDLRHPDPKSPLALSPDMVAIADTLRELATQMGVDAAGLEATVTRYNGFVDVGRDEDFEKPKPAYKLTKPPFYAAKMAMLHHTCRNGVRVNTKSQVIDRSEQWTRKGVPIDEEKTIPRLYAAGECANYMGNYHIHQTLGIYEYYGRVAGKNAAAEKAFAS